MSPRAAVLAGTAGARSYGESIKRLALDRGGLLAILVLALYVAIAPTHVVDIDNAEFSALGKIGGIAHPSGYPAYVLWLRLMSWLPGTTPAHTAALATALLAALQIVVLHAACRAWGIRPLAATIAVGIYAAAPLVMRYSSEAEVFALNGLAVATVLWLAAVAGPLRGAWRIGALALVAGIGMANNLTCVLIAPVGLLGAVRAVRECGRRWPIGVVAGVLGLAVGLSPYLYLFVAPDNLLSPGTPHSLGELLDIFLRRQYGGATGFLSAGKEVPYLAQLEALLRSVGRSWLWVLLPVGVAMLGYRIARPRAESRAGWIALAASVVLAGPVLAARFDLPTDAVGLYIVRRFHLLPVLLLVIPVAAGLDLAGTALGRRMRDAVAIALALASFVALAVAALPDVRRFHSPALELVVRNTLASLPPNAVMFGTTDEFDVTMRYLQLAVGLRPDVVFVRPGAMWDPRYAARFARDGLVFDPAKDSSVTLAGRVLESGRPLFVTPWEKDVIKAYPSYRFGVLMRVLPPTAAAPSLDDIIALDRAVFEKFELDYPTPGPDDEVATIVHVHYAGVWKHIGDALTVAGRRDEAASAYEVSRQLAPKE